MSENVFYIAPQGELDHFYDCFCGGGGSGTGILNAYHRLGVQANGTFVNHWDRAIDIHEANHPEHRHFREDLFLMDPKEHMPRRRYGLGWASPSCQQFSLSRGNRPINEQGRTHAATVVTWMKHCRPECQIVENVKQFKDWCRLKQSRCKKNGELLWAMELPGKKKGTTKVQTFPILPPAHARADGESEEAHAERMFALGYLRHLQPDLDYRGEYFREWIQEIEALGYMSDFRLLRSADYGDPTIRERLFVMFVRKDTGKRIVWPDQRFIKPGAKRPKFKTDPNRPLHPWPTARSSVIDWTHKGESIFLPTRKALAQATKRRIAIGLVQFGLKNVLARAQQTVDAVALTSNKGFGHGPRELDKPAGTMTCNSRGEGLVEPYIIPKDQGHKGDYVTSIEHPVPAVQTTAHDHLVEPYITQLRGTGRAASVDEPVRALTASGQHQLLTEAFLLVLDNAGKDGANQRVYSADEPIKTIPVKGNQTIAEPRLTPIPECAKFSLETLEDAVRKVAPAGIDISRALNLLEPLMAELKKAGRGDIKPWVYVYYSNGAVGADIDTPVPTVRCKEGTAICYPVLEFDGEFMLLDVLYRMLSVKELQRAQGFPDDFKWPAGISKTDIVKAIGNSVSCGVAEALTLAWYSQNEDISGFFEKEAVAA